MFEIRIHSRGGQGGVTAARLLALAAIHDGKYATACPFYGAERRGAPIVSFVRIDESPIRIRARKPVASPIAMPPIEMAGSVDTNLSPSRP
jgi:2-oxoacid:acceptor oxidoreductase gamma subunit (pyruvate/2-ketoisovalerate family)